MNMLTTSSLVYLEELVLFSNVGSGVLALNVPPPSSKVAKHGQSGWIITRQVRGKHCFWVEP